jgi:hypothetical protein
MKQLISILIVVIFCNSLFGQKHDNIWTMGYAYDSTINPCNYYIDFTDSFKIVNQCLGLNQISFGNSSISDSTGNLLFYTNGCLVADSSFQIMNNGTGINNNTNTLYNLYGYPNKTMILPKPNSLNLYYLFTLENTTWPNGQINSIFSRWLNYNLIDMRENNGLGDVVLKNIVLLDDSIGGGGNLLTACKHANGQDWWILVPEYESNAYYRFLLTEDSIYGPFRQEVGFGFNRIDYNGQAVFSPDGSLYVRYDPYNQAHLYDFNRCTGELSYRQQINVPSRSNAGGAAISPNSRFLYIANDTIVFQYDLQAANINSSRVTVAIYDGFLSPGPVAFSMKQLAPNGKIYGISGSTTDRLHVIEYPDSAGLACSFRQHAIITPRYSGRALPNFPHFRTPALPAGACDTSGVLAIATPFENIKIYPNPSYNGRFNISLGENYADLIQVQDLLGRLLLQEIWDTNEKEKEMQLPSGAKGIYFVSIWRDGKLIKREKILLLD